MGQTISGRRSKNKKNLQRQEFNMQPVTLDLDTSKLATESSEHEVSIHFCKKIETVIHAF